MRLRRYHRQLPERRKIHRKKAWQRSGTNRRSTTTGVLLHRQTGGTNHPPEVEVIEVTETIETEIETEEEEEEEEEGLPGGIRDHVA